MHAQPPAIFNQTLQADVVALLGHPDPLERPPARLQRLGHGVDAIDVVHEYSVYRNAGGRLQRLALSSRDGWPRERRDEPRIRRQRSCRRARSSAVPLSACNRQHEASAPEEHRTMSSGSGRSV